MFKVSKGVLENRRGVAASWEYDRWAVRLVYPPFAQWYVIRVLDLDFCRHRPPANPNKHIFYPALDREVQRQAKPR